MRIIRKRCGRDGKRGDSGSGNLSEECGRDHGDHGGNGESR